MLEGLQDNVDELYDVDVADDVNLTLITFSISNETYAIPIHDLQEIINVPEIIKVPRSVDFLEGVINLRGKIVPVISLRRRLGMKTIPYNEDTRIIILHMNENPLGLIVDSVAEVVNITRDSVGSVSNVVSSVNAIYVQGIAKVKDHILTILNINTLISVTSEEKAHYEMVLAEEGRKNYFEFIKRYNG